MQTAEKITEALFEAIDELNQQQPEDQQVQKEMNTPLFGSDGVLDSYALVNLIVTIEQKIQEKLDIAVTLADEKAMSQKNSPFRTVEALAGYIQQLIGPCGGT